MAGSGKSYISTSEILGIPALPKKNIWTNGHKGLMICYCLCCTCWIIFVVPCSQGWSHVPSALWFPTRQDLCAHHIPLISTLAALGEVKSDRKESWWPLSRFYNLVYQDMRAGGTLWDPHSKDRALQAWHPEIIILQLPCANSNVLVWHY